MSFNFFSARPKNIKIALACLVISIASCQRSPEQINKFSDPVMVRIGDLKDRRLSDSLYRFFESEDPLYQREALLAFASIQDSSAANKIAGMLLDDNVDVRKAAAFSLGQIQSKQSEIILLKAIENETENTVRAEIIEAYGKVTGKWQLKIAEDDSDAALALGWGFYRAGINGTIDSTYHSRASSLLSAEYSTPIRLGAAHYFARPAKGFEKFQYSIITSAKSDTSVVVRIASTLALRKIKTDSSRAAAQRLALGDSDYRVRVNALRALQSFSYELTNPTLLKALSDQNVNVGITASEIIKSTITASYWKELVPVCRATVNWRIQANLFEAALAVSDHKELAEEIVSRYNNAIDPYHKAALLSALKQSVMSYGFVQEQLFQAASPLIRTTAATTLVEINYRKNFEPALAKRFASIYVKAITGDDPAVTGIISAALADSTLGYEKIINDFSFLYEARKKLSLPRDNESIHPLEAAIAYFEGKSRQPQGQNQFNHPIDWQAVKNIPRDQMATITTSRGDIVIRLFVEEVPGTVANFVDLVNKQYFDGKFFHRVVPNFVVQTGCYRGDGYGSEDYSIRSEFSERRYKSGSVGMASSGKDTEGTQWFITHSPTPHLDGRYTIFAEVVAGMDVVHRIEIGDKILKIKLNR